MFDQFSICLTHICFLPDEWEHETSGSNKQDLKVSAFIQIGFKSQLFSVFSTTSRHFSSRSNFWPQFLAQAALDRLATTFSLNFLPGLSVHGGNMANTAVTDKTSDFSDFPFLNIL